MDERRFLQWLSGVPSCAAPDRPRPDGRKRKLQTPPSHDPDVDTDTMETPAKRHQGAATGPGDDQTPRPARQRPSALASSLPSTSSKPSRTDSSRGSPIKRKRAMKSGDEPLTTMSFAGAGRQGKMLPTALRRLELDFKKANGGMPIISWSRKAEIEAAGASGESILEHHFLPPPSPEAKNADAESPAFSDVLEIWETAGQYAAMSFDDASARVPDRELLPPTCPIGKVIDFCVAMDPGWTPGHANASEDADMSNVALESPQLTINHATETEAAAAVRLLKSMQHNWSINHTDHLPLTEYPIALSIELKRSDGNAVESETQLGVWQFAHWKMLGLLAETEFDGRPPVVGALESLEFLPGIYIVGHQWRFAATVKNMATGHVTQLIDGTFGNTADIHGIYCIIWGLRRLARYLTEEYWTWFKDKILRLSPSETDGGHSSSASCL
ncbi:hypothetical protein MAPG_10721 [Magnaporthiopsis poae ATCC 64411]|uniref:PD-(D/E)XK nuclease-like domain-containing protein n=1 Tax=Magnaporthiopsis poae (strain ATCC 64411 / 73-15) TaxID=644358 RepID=A0A0C4EDC6_MAGP6|nr:hypothetical protein MAPG_10721 [Magnaporthiopsis poae ATCC 64411]